MYKRLFEKKKAVTFDLDGTLLNTEPLWEQAFKNIIGTLETFVDYSALPTGTSVTDKWHYIMDTYEINTPFKAAELADHTNTEYLNILDASDLEVTDGFWGLGVELKVDKGFKLGLVTNTVRSVTEVTLERVGFGDTFDMIVCGEEVKRGKPYPDIYNKAVENLGLKKSEILAFEDSITGSLASTQAGIDTLVIWDEVTPHEKFPNKVIDFFPNFNSFPGNLDTVLADHWNEYSKYLEKQLAESEEKQKDTKNTSEK